nr:lipopolysaccharide biosynthesis protein [Candidatus Sigynarchaeota archaeon]
MFKKKDKAAEKQKQALIRTQTQEEFIHEAKEMFKGADVDWDRYQREHPTINIEEIKEKVRNVKGWDSIGFHRVLGGYFYDYGLSILEMMLGFVLFPLTILILIPWPEASGYYGVAAGFFATLFNIFDFGTAFSIERFIGEYRVKDPKKMIGFISFYVWWQMLTGLIQVTIVSMFALFFFPGTSLAYASWLFLILSTTQYPGMLGYFKSVIRGLQAFHYDNIIDFFRSNVFDLITSIIFVLLFRWIGANNPAIGELMGLAIGSALGHYLDEFINEALAIWFFNKIMKPHGFRGRDCFNHRYITPDIVKTCMWWGFQLSLPGMVGGFWGFASLLITIQYMPNYAYWGPVSGVLGMITRILTIGSKLSLTPAIAEAFMNGKKRLAQFYLENAFKWYFVILIGVAGLLAVFLPHLLTVIFMIPGTENYRLAIPFAIPMILSSAFGPIDGYFNEIIVAANHPTAKTIWEIAGQASGFVWHVFCLVIIGWPLMGLQGIIMQYTFAGFAHWLIYFFIKWLFCEFYIFHIKFPVGQAFIAPFLTTVLGILPIGYLYLYGLYYPVLIPGFTALVGLFGVSDPIYIGSLIAAGITLIMALVVFLFAVYLPLYSFFGGWDEFGLLVFRAAYHLTGPSKPLIYLMYKGCERGARLSAKLGKWQLHNRFPIEATIPYIQCLELLVERTIHDVETGFEAGTVFKKPEESKPAEKSIIANPPRFYLTEFIKDFRKFFTQTTPFQKRCILFCIVLYAIGLTPIMFFPLGKYAFSLEMAWIVWASYIAIVSIVGASGLALSIRWLKKHDVDLTKTKEIPSLSAIVKQ